MQTTLPSASSGDDVVRVLSHLEALWAILEAEIAVINQDIEHCSGCLSKYGETFSAPLQHLRDLKAQKKHAMGQILQSMEGFHRVVAGGRRIIAAVERSAPLAASIDPTAAFVPAPAPRAPLQGSDVGYGQQQHQQQMRSSRS
jgi:hypothetical protein